jgi:hypothetical protein
MWQMNPELNCVYGQIHIAILVCQFTFCQPVIHKWVFNADLIVTTYFSVCICVNIDSVPRHRCEVYQ